MNHEYLKQNRNQSFCRFCLAFCGIKIHEGNLTPRVSGDREHPNSKGYTCKKGQNIVNFYSRGRLTSALHNGNDFNYDSAIEILSAKIKKNIDENGPDSVAIYLATNAILDALTMWTALGFMYRINSRSIFTVSSIDGINKLAAVNSITSGCNPGLIPHIDYEHADLALFLGTNPLNSHGHLAGTPAPQKKIRDLLKRGGKVVVIDPRGSRLSHMSSLHLQPNPGTDYALLACALRHLLGEGSNSLDHDYLEKHCGGIDDLRDLVNEFTFEKTSDICGISKRDLTCFCGLIASSKSFAGVSGTGISFADTGIVTEHFLWSLLAIKGSLDRKGGIWFSDGYDAFSAHKDTSRRSGSEYIEEWSSSMFSERHKDSETPRRHSEGAISAISHQIHIGAIKTLIVVGGNPLTAFPNASRLKSSLSKLDNLVVLETHKTSLTDLATFSFPVAAPLERLDTTAYAIKSLRKPYIQVSHPIFDPCGESRHGWRVLSEIGDNIGIDVCRLNKKTKDIKDEEVMLGIKGLSEIINVSSGNLKENMIIGPSATNFGHIVISLPQQKWRVSSRLLKDELIRISDGPINSQAKKALDPQGKSCNLISMRNYEDLNSQFVSSNLTLESLPTGFISEHDASRLGLSHGSLCKIDGSNDSIVCKVNIDNSILRGCIAIPQGYCWKGNVARLTCDSEKLNPVTGMPSQTALEVIVRPID